MNRLPRPIADWLALWRDLPRHPRQVLLNRSHSSASTIVIAVLALMDSLAIHPYTTELLAAALAVGGPSSLVAITGACAHKAWEHGRLWIDLECQWCRDDDGDNGHDDEPEPDDPDDPHGIARDAAAWLRTALTHTH